MVASSSSDFQSTDRASARVLARGVGETSSTHAHSSYVLQLHPTQQPQQDGGQKKRSHAEANVDNERGSLTSAPRSSASSASSLSSLNSVALVAGMADEDAGDGVPKVKKTRGKPKAASPSESKKSNPVKGKASKKRTGSEESTNASGMSFSVVICTLLMTHSLYTVLIPVPAPHSRTMHYTTVASQTDSSQNGKEKEKMEVNYHYPFQNGQLPLLDPHITMQLGYGVSVMPIQEGVPIIRAIGFPYPIQMHSLGPGMPVALAAAQNQHQANLFPELQFARCMSARYRSDAFPRCVSCTRRWAGDTCRFQNIRILLRDTNKNLIAVGFQSLLAKCEGTQLVYPEKWNVNLERSHVDRIMETVADALLPHLQKEQAHQKLGNVVKRQRETDVRATCDTCMTSLFSSSWMCRQCGREACEECYQTICRLTAEPSSTSVASGKERGNAVSGSTQRSIRERHAQTNPFFLSCNRKAEHGVHTFNPVTRFVQSELDDAVKEMVRLVKGEGPEMDVDENLESKQDGGKAGGVKTNGTGGSQREHSMDIDTPRSPSSPRSNLESPTNGKSKEHVGKTASGLGKTTPAISLTPSVYDDRVCSLVKNPVPPSTFSSSSSLDDLPPTSPTDLKPPTWPIPYYTATNLSEPVFAAQWARGTPLVVTGLLNRFALRWTPDYFIKTYGPQPCIILECQTDSNKKVTVGEFFSCFGKYEGRSECWKLKDWPPSADFKTVFPELYDDFSRAVPIPNYSRRDGAMNIASHFPINTIAPDLGPKMYNAYASNEDKGTKGSTRLHMDMADAVNIMVHSETTADNAPGCAVWDIFRAEDSVHLRSFFKRHFKGQYQNDPIHAQTFYLDMDLRGQLFEEFGVRSFRIYQRPGEAVFIPAGCAHQVCNLADTIKVACDFVSPENIERCETLTREFRAQNQSLVWKEDVLQLRSMMWFAWLSCWKQQAKWRDNGEEEELTAVSGPKNGVREREGSASVSNGS
ncbi:hypothetical protein M0805_007058 [Coniferiporia weirii]|nr:hypothetical protein M0805_007058 [Coniferiporia weirii]